MRRGDDASCNNLYQSAEPTVLGVADSMGQQQADRASEDQETFPWASTADLSAVKTLESPSNKTNAWMLLATEAAGTQADPIPTVLDLNTAMWALHKGASMGGIYSFDFDGQTVYFQTVGLLQNTVLQGSLIIGEANCRRVFPTVEGFEFFLMRTENGDEQAAAQATRLLESRWGDQGLDVQSTYAVLQQLLAVQNTYLSAFQALGALGVLLGTFGLAIVQFRSVLERRGELGLLSAVGYSKRRVEGLLTLETLWLLLGGVGIGVGAALLSAVPAWLAGQSTANFVWPTTMIAMVLIVGFSAGWFAVHRASNAPLLDKLRAK
jgi:ABC-type antimicrobial peptide transport system permease subunit